MDGLIDLILDQIEAPLDPLTGAPDVHACHSWTGKFASHGPTTSAPKPLVVDGKHSTSAIRVLFEWYHERKLSAKEIVTFSCGASYCMNPEHMVAEVYQRPPQEYDKRLGKIDPRQMKRDRKTRLAEFEDELVAEYEARRPTDSPPPETVPPVVAPTKPRGRIITRDEVSEYIDRKHPGVNSDEMADGDRFALFLGAIVQEGAPKNKKHHTLSHEDAVARGRLGGKAAAKTKRLTTAEAKALGSKGGKATAKKRTAANPSERARRARANEDPVKLQARLSKAGQAYAASKTPEEHKEYMAWVTSHKKKKDPNAWREHAREYLENL